MEDLGARLFDACKVGDVDLVEELIARGANVNWKNHLGKTPGFQFFISTKIILLIDCLSQLLH